MIKKDDFLDAINSIKKVQKQLVPYLPLSEDFIFANIQMQIAIRLIEDGLCEIDNREAGMPGIKFIPLS